MTGRVPSKLYICFVYAKRVLRPRKKGWVHSQCQSFNCQRGPVVDFADLVVARIIIACAARPSSALRYKKWGCNVGQQNTQIKFKKV